MEHAAGSRFLTFNLSTCLCNASGPRCSSLEQIEILAKNPNVGAVWSKSATIEPRTGNPLPRYSETDFGSINSEGLPNKGFHYYAKLGKAVHRHGKPYILSISGLKLMNNLKMFQLLENYEDIDAVELNLSCPNVIGKPQMGYDFAQMTQCLDTLAPYFVKRPVGVKLPPYFDMIHFKQVAEILNRYEIAWVTCCNTMGNGLIVDVKKEKPVISPKGGFGGIAGGYMLPTSLANVRQFSKLLRDDIVVIGVGGIRTGADAFAHLLCGAQIIQVATTHRREGGDCFKRIINELGTLMQQKGYNSIEEFRGKLRKPKQIKARSKL